MHRVTRPSRTSSAIAIDPRPSHSRRYRTRLSVVCGRDSQMRALRRRPPQSRSSAQRFPSRRTPASCADGQVAADEQGGGDGLEHGQSSRTGLDPHGGDGRRSAGDLLPRVPESWCSWRRQLAVVAAAGFRAVATGTCAWVVLAVWAVVSPALAVTFFRWEWFPRRRPRRAGRRFGTCRPSCLQRRRWRSLAPSLRASGNGW
jgi:hypothetical protein